MEGFGETLNTWVNYKVHTFIFKNVIFKGRFSGNDFQRLKEWYR